MTRKMKNGILAIPAALAAIPPKPRIAAIIAITRNVRAQPSTVASMNAHVCERHHWQRFPAHRREGDLVRSGLRHRAPERLARPDGIEQRPVPLLHHVAHRE